jgi:hypothetical protein
VLPKWLNRFTWNDSLHRHQKSFPLQEQQLGKGTPKANLCVFVPSCAQLGNLRATHIYVLSNWPAELESGRQMS